MGLYTWVSKYCCNEELQFQSKSHPTEEYGEIDLDAVPVEVARDIENEYQECPHCLRQYQIVRRPRDLDTTPMMIVCTNDDDIGTHKEDEDEDSTEERLARLERQLGLK